MDEKIIVGLINLEAKVSCKSSYFCSLLVWVSGKCVSGGLRCFG